MRARRLLLATAALSSSLACKREERPLPGNPKGSFYADAGPITPNLPGNPKGVTYDAAEPTPPPTPIDAGAPDAPIVRQLPAK